MPGEGFSSISSVLLRATLVLLLLLLGCLSAAEGSKEGISDVGDRVVIRYAKGSSLSGLGGEAASEPFESSTLAATFAARLSLHAEGIPNRHDGVVEVKALPNMGMAIVSLSSREKAEDFIEALHDDDAVELAVLDTWVTAFDLGVKPGLPDLTQLERRLGGGATGHGSDCADHPACVMQGHTGTCCPAEEGARRSCCSPSSQHLVALRTFHGTFLAVDSSGHVTQVATIQDASEFDIQKNQVQSGSFAFKSKLGTYLAANDRSQIFANKDFAAGSSGQMFSIINNKNGTVSLETHFNKFLCAEPSGGVVADRETISLWEQFEVVQLASPQQRIPDDPDMSRLWGLHSYENYDIDAPEAWKFSTGEIGDGVTVAVIDTGIDFTHPDLAEQMWVNPLEIPDNGIDDDGNGYIDDVHGADLVKGTGDCMDNQDHGTHCAGTIAGIGNNGVGVVGVAWRGVRLMALKFLDAGGAGRASDGILAIDYAVAHGARISSNSWGGGGSNPALRSAIEHAEASGMLFLAAAGNDGQNNDWRASFPANYDMGNVISVGATMRDGSLAPYSCYGPTTVDVAAPGNDILSTFPGGRYGVLSGTSMATPHVSGLAALVWMYRPRLSVQQVKDVIMGSVAKLPSLEGKMVTGGLINARNAMQAAWAFEPDKPPSSPPKGIMFQDRDSEVGKFGGPIKILAADNESDIEYYRVYFVSGAGYQLQALGERIPKTGEPELVLDLNASWSPPKYAKHLVVVAGSSTGQLPAHQGGPAPSIVLHDYALPKQGPVGATWNGDADLREGYVSGRLRVSRAADEKTITNYNVYWQDASGTRGSPVGRIDGIGNRLPECQGDACDLLNLRRNEDGKWRFGRLPYGPGEQAKILVSGPGTLRLVSFITEHYYDALTIGTDVRVSGNLSGRVPYEITLPAETVEIQWRSDDSVQGAGFECELEQFATEAELVVPPSQVEEGTTLQIVPAYEEYELEDLGLNVELTDYTESMQVSPAFAPSALALEDDGETSKIIPETPVVTIPASSGGILDLVSISTVAAEGSASHISNRTNNSQMAALETAHHGGGVQPALGGGELQPLLQGIAVVTPSREAAPNGLVTYYRVAFADASGNLLNEGWLGTPNTTEWSQLVRVVIPPTEVPRAAVAIVAKAGGPGGLGAGSASLPRSVWMSEERQQSQNQGPARRLAADDFPAGRPQEVPLKESELRAKEAAPSKSSSLEQASFYPVWSLSPDSSSPASPEAGSSGHSVAGTVLLEGLSASELARSDVLKRSLLSTLLARIAEGGRTAAAPQGALLSISATEDRKDVAKVDFAVSATGSAARLDTDKIEAFLILLSRGNRESTRFDLALTLQLPRALRNGLNLDSFFSTPRLIPQTTWMASFEASSRFEQSLSSVNAAATTAAASSTAAAAAPAENEGGARRLRGTIVV